MPVRISTRPSCSVTPPLEPLPPNVALLLLLNATVPVASGKVIVRSAVGSVNVTVVSWSLALEPSTVNPASLRNKPVTVGLVIVLFVSVFVVPEK